MNVGNTIKQILADDVFVEVPIADMDEDASLRDVYGLDSLGFVELRVQCESAFGIEIGAADFTPEHFDTVRTVAALVRRLQPVGATAGDPA